MKIPFTKKNPVILGSSVCLSSYKRHRSLVMYKGFVIFFIIFYIFLLWPLNICSITHFVRLFIYDFLYIATYGCCNPCFWHMQMKMKNFAAISQTNVYGLLSAKRLMVYYTTSFIWFKHLQSSVWPFAC